MNDKLDKIPGNGVEDSLTQPNQIDEPKSFDWLSAGQFALSLIAAALLLGAFLVSSLLISLGTFFTLDPELIPKDIPSRNFMAGLGFGGLLMLPSLIYSGRRLFNRKEPQLIEFKNLIWITILLPFPFVIGYLIQIGPEWSHQFLPLIHVLANGVGVLWVITLVRGRIPGESAQRVWGSFVSGISLVPPLAFLIEIILLIAIGVLWIFILQTNQEYANDLQMFYQMVQNSSGNMEIPQAWAEEFITRPGVIGTILFYIAGLVPLVEELLKPMVLWFVLHQKPHPREGFLIGATAGAGYAMFENLTIGASLDDWVFITISRLGTAAVHVLASGLVGWGLASASTDKKVFRLIAAYLMAVGLHAVWNGLNIITALGDFPTFQARVQPFISGFAEFAPVGLVLLAFGSIFGLMRANSLFRRAIIAQDSEK